MGTIQVTPGEPGRLIVHFPYSTERVTVIRAVPGRRWHPEEKYWTVPHTPETLERMRNPFTSDRVVAAAAVEAASKELPVARVREIVRAMDEVLTLRGCSASTRENYRLQAQRFLKWLRQEPKTATDSSRGSFAFSFKFTSYLNIIQGSHILRGPTMSILASTPSVFLWWPTMCASSCTSH